MVAKRPRHGGKAAMIRAKLGRHPGFARMIIWYNKSNIKPMVPFCRLVQMTNKRAAAYIKVLFESPNEAAKAAEATSTSRAGTLHFETWVMKRRAQKGETSEKSQTEGPKNVGKA
jgi:hypothetical protein